jgi:hypothetical protein
MTIAAIFLIAAVILCALAGFGVGAPRFTLGWFGVACLAMAFVLNSGLVH